MVGLITAKDIADELDLTAWYENMPKMAQDYLTGMIDTEVPNDERQAFVEGYLHGAYKMDDLLEDLEREPCECGNPHPCDHKYEDECIKAGCVCCTTLQGHYS